ncbi:hypothetical protein [Glutamicibacter ardleyensis]|uniref:hypothetical protein n=1 Tax=Glutamicibacter ardleyensis TaxID=225894 RepID=UPI003FD5762B
MTISNAEIARLCGLQDSKNPTARNHALTTDNTENLRLLAQHESPFVINGLITNPATPDTMLIEFWEMRFKQAMIAEQPRIIGSPVYTHIVNDANDGYLVASNPHLTSKLIDELLKLHEEPTHANRRRRLIEKLSYNPATPTELLTRFYAEYPMIKAGLASNPSTSPDILRELSKERNRHLDSSLARNPSTPRP